MFDKVWNEHCVASLGTGFDLIHVDRLLMHDLAGPISLQRIEDRGLSIHSPGLVYAVPDHLVTSVPGKRGAMLEKFNGYINALREACSRQGITLFDVDDHRQGIVHVVGPALGVTLPGATVICGDSHTCTHGGIGAIAWGIGISEQDHALATQCIIEKKPKTMQVEFVGTRPVGVSAKDMILHAIAIHGSGFGDGYAVEYRGKPVEALAIEERFTICNMSVEFGAKIGFVAPDGKTLDYLRDLEFAPRGDLFEDAARHWLSLRTDNGASFHASLTVDVGNLRPQVSWGINPAHTIGIDDCIPDPDDAPDADTRHNWSMALEYMGLRAGDRIQGTPIDHVFIGSCTNSRLSDLAAAAAVIKGKQVADGVEAWVVAGSQQVKKDAEAQGLDEIFRQSGFQWREPGCSLCPAANGDVVGPEKRCVSTSNRNFMGRQGPRARTHLASPQTAAAAAVAGRIVDPGTL